MRSYDALLPLSVLMFITYVQSETLHFEKEPANVTVLPGDNTVLQCVIKSEYTSEYVVTWYLDDQQFDLNDYDDYAFIDGNYYNTGNWSMKITNIHVNQRDGSYHCRYTKHGEGGPVENSRKGEVMVAFAPTLSMEFKGVDVTDDEEVTVKADDTEEEFKCKAQGGNPDPVFNWFVDSENITGSAVQDGTDSSILNHAFRPGKDGDNGAVLQCRVFVHELLGMQFLNKTLDAQYMIEDFDIKILHDGEETIDAGDKLELECAADGNPEPVYTWSKDTNALQETSRILIRKSVTLEDEGLYKCEASNDFGEGSAELQITVNEKTNVAMIVGLTFGVLVLVIIIIAIFAFVKKIWCFKRMAPAKPDEEQTGGPNSYVMNPQPTHYPDNSAMRQRGEFEDTANLYAKPDKTKKKESQKHPVAQEFEAVYKKDAPSQKARPAPNPNNVEGITYADLDLIKTGQSGLPPRDEESTVYSQIKPSVRV